MSLVERMFECRAAIVFASMALSPLPQQDAKDGAPPQNTPGDDDGIDVDLSLVSEIASLNPHSYVFDRVLRREFWFQDHFQKEIAFAEFMGAHLASQLGGMGERRVQEEEEQRLKQLAHE